jgi:hypothetical protein
VDYRTFAENERIKERKADGIDAERMEVYHAKYDSELGWVHIPGRRIPDFYGQGLTMTINHDGLRGTVDYLGKKPVGKYRVVCLGDSMTMGYGVDDTDTYSARLQDANSQLQVVNMGMGGYSVCQCGVWYRRLHPKLEADLVVFTFIVEDIARINQQNTPRFAVANDRVEVTNVPVPQIFWPDERLDDARRTTGFLMKHNAITRTMGSLFKVESNESAGWLPQGDVMKLAQATIAELAQMTKAKGIGFAVVLMPNSNVIAGHSDYNIEKYRRYVMVSNLLHKTALKLKVPYLDLNASFVLHEKPESLYLREIYRHLSPGGHELVARKFDMWLASYFSSYPRLKKR